MTKNENIEKCPACDESALVQVPSTEGTYQCEACDYRTHEKIEQWRDELETLANQDLAVSKRAKQLTQTSTSEQ